MEIGIINKLERQVIKMLQQKILDKLEEIIKQLDKMIKENNDFIEAWRMSQGIKPKEEKELNK
jgi:hypothetical protein